jgi:cold shock CspA family protein
MAGVVAHLVGAVSRMTVRPSASTVSTRQYGVVKINSQTWVVPDGSSDGIFAHRSQFPRGILPILKTGCRVTFTIGVFRGRSCAEDIRLEPGWLEWLRGEIGCRFSSPFAFLADRPRDPRNRKPRAYRSVVVLAIITLHDIYTTIMEPYAAQKNKRNESRIAADKKAAGKLYYFEEGSTKQLWRARARNSPDVQMAVGDARSFVERLHSVVLRDPNAAKTYLRVDPLRSDDRDDRWRKLTSLVHSLWRGSDSGPDAPLHWAQHVGDNKYRFTFVTKQSIMELVEKLGSILEVLFVGRPLLQLPTRQCAGRCFRFESGPR